MFTTTILHLPPAVLLAVLLAACSKPSPKNEEIRPVRAMVLATADVVDSVEYPGEVRPRYESQLGFRVGGKIVARKVDVGAIVRRGQMLMQLDTQDLKLAQAQAQAGLRAAVTGRDFAAEDLKRYQELRAKNFVSQATLDSKAAVLQQAQANVEVAAAGARAQSNQVSYAALLSDTDGVVTAVDAEVGQVVGVGVSVVRVARTDKKEVVIGVPEDRVEDVLRADSVTVRLWADPDAFIAGKIREVAPSADPATRTYLVKVAVPPSPAIRLGMTASVQFVVRSAKRQLRVPVVALVQDKGTSAVWVVERGEARLTPVSIGQPVGNDMVIESGVQAGQVVVTSGVHMLKNGQKVRILTADIARSADLDKQAKDAGASR